MPKSLTLNAYQEAARRTDDKNSFANDRERLACWGLGVAGEAGEVADLIKKTLFHGRPFDREHLANELGDVLWYVALAADAAGFTLEEVASRNLAKLRARYPDGFSHEASAKRAARVFRCGQADERHEHYSNVARAVCKEERARYASPPLVGKRQEA